MNRSLDALSDRFKPLAIALLARLVEAQIPVIITYTLRTAAEQAEAVRTGHSKVAHSHHQDGDAIDICPFDQYQLHGPDKLQWDGEDPIWFKIGVVGEALGLRWGGRFPPLNDAGIGWDPGHFEFVAPVSAPPTTRI